ncbi:hypothetical protein EDC01DRAFT_673815 [Geopyxis carbonaria]|nr:hypothetical protein EDC01DRAFT_673815 [Geopyxis carbonaria]
MTFPRNRRSPPVTWPVLLLSAVVIKASNILITTDLGSGLIPVVLTSPSTEAHDQDGARYGCGRTEGIPLACRQLEYFPYGWRPLRSQIWDISCAK